jgi:hypothetical protein
MLQQIRISLCQQTDISIKNGNFRTGSNYPNLFKKGLHNGIPVNSIFTFPVFRLILPVFPCIF